MPWALKWETIIVPGFREIGLACHVDVSNAVSNKAKKRAVLNFWFRTALFLCPEQDSNLHDL